MSRFAGQFGCGGACVGILVGAFVGALLWGLPFLLAAVGVPLFNALRGSPFPISSHKRWKRDYAWLVVARTLSGAFFGVVMVLAVALLTYLAGQHDDRYVVVFGLSGFFLAHLAGSILFAGMSTLVPDFDAVREWTARAGGWFLVSALVWTVYTSLVLLDLPDGWPEKLVNLLVASGGTIAGVASAVFGHSTSTPAREGQKSSSNNWNGVAAAGAVFFSVVLVFEISRAFDWALTGCYALCSYDIGMPPIAQNPRWDIG